MNNIDYLRKHPIDFVTADGRARVRLFVCPIDEDGCDDHPMLQIHEPADEPDVNADTVPFKEVVGALGWMLRASSALLFDAILGREQGQPAEKMNGFERGGIEIAAAAVKYYNEMTGAIARSKLN